MKPTHLLEISSPSPPSRYTCAIPKSSLSPRSSKMEGMPDTNTEIGRRRQMPNSNKPAVHRTQSRSVHDLCPRASHNPCGELQQTRCRINCTPRRESLLSRCWYSQRRSRGTVFRNRREWPFNRGLVLQLAMHRRARAPPEATSPGSWCLHRPQACGTAGAHQQHQRRCTLLG